jgi:hypothetical protein
MQSPVALIPQLVEGVFSLVFLAIEADYDTHYDIPACGKILSGEHRSQGQMQQPRQVMERGRTAI